MNKYLFVPVSILIILLVIGVIYLSGEDTPEPAAGSVTRTLQSWAWENPFTYQSTPLPSEWQAANHIQDTLLTLTHETGKSLVYLIYEATEDTMSLQDYVDALATANTTELGTGDFKTIIDGSGQEYYQASGARYLGNDLVATNVRIWSDQPDHFWRTVSITNMEYKELEYEAEQVVDLLYASAQ